MYAYVSSLPIASAILSYNPFIYMSQTTAQARKMGYSAKDSIKISMYKTGGTTFKAAVLNGLSFCGLLFSNTPVLNQVQSLSSSLLLQPLLYSYNLFSRIIHHPYWRITFSCHQVQLLSLSLLFNSRRFSHNRFSPLVHHPRLDSSCLLLLPSTS